MVNLKSGTFVVIMLLNKHLTQVHSQKDPRFHFGESFTLNHHLPDNCVDQISYKK